ncbi:MAG: hypothetical protein KBC95_02175 [Candidatus Peribacteraceae bacterium]|nr:hypothetical protein [Candidatus Peribacteraceae bacterium]
MPLDKDHPAEHELTYLARFPAVQRHDVGRLVGAGAQHVVRAYGESEVVKYPRAKTWRDIFSKLVSPGITPSVDEMERDVALSSETFGPTVVAPRVEATAERDAYTLVQPFLPIDDLLPMHMEDGDLHDELAQLLDQNRKLLLDHRLWLDVMGFNGSKLLAAKPYLDNVSLRRNPKPEEPRLAVLDCSLFPAPNLSIRGIHAWVLRHVQALNLRAYGQRL